MLAADPFGLVGQRVDGKYAVEAMTAQGGFSVVYRAEHLLWQQKVAIKVFRYSDDPAMNRLDLLEGFLQEGRILAHLSALSPAVCQARDAGAVLAGDGETWAPFLVLEWLEGLPLSALLREEKRAGRAARTLTETIELFDPAARALALAHARGVTHRDIKPGNLFVLPDAPSGTPRVKVIDFAVADIVPDGPLGVGPTPRARETLSRLFTPSYGAPEQFDPDLGDSAPATDVFAFALVLLRVLSGKPPLPGPGLSAYAQQALDPARRPGPDALGVDASPAVEAVFARALAVEPRHRFADVGAFWDALREAAQYPGERADGEAEVRPSGLRLVAPFAAAR